MHFLGAVHWVAASSPSRPVKLAPPAGGLALSTMLGAPCHTHLWKKMPQVSSGLRSCHVTPSTVRTAARPSQSTGSLSLEPTSLGQLETKNIKHNSQSTKPPSSTSSANLGPGRCRKPVRRPSKAQLKEVALCKEQAQHRKLPGCHTAARTNPPDTSGIPSSKRRTSHTSPPLMDQPVVPSHTERSHVLLFHYSPQRDTCQVWRGVPLYLQQPTTLPAAEGGLQEFSRGWWAMIARVVAKSAKAAVSHRHSAPHYPEPGKHQSSFSLQPPRLEGREY
ncbi:ataxin-7-like protein 2 isoform X1 [Lates japonicus]|uniref:Ataxin-7-like protein 2 isoform X1 n=1 Tax=Lates japonicus TaxID=270547 RepID=A0AAD3M316_LATJO|nr:ataxin-7-like protein 2 isoform X1 [Lates japonicus]